MTEKERNRMKKKNRKNRMLEPFVITTVCREDLTQLVNADNMQYFTDAEILKISDENMEWLASEIADGIMDTFWMIIENNKEELLK